MKDELGLLMVLVGASKLSRTPGNEEIYLEFPGVPRSFSARAIREYLEKMVGGKWMIENVLIEGDYMEVSMRREE